MLVKRTLARGSGNGVYYFFETFFADFVCVLTVLSLTELVIRFLENGKLRDIIRTLRNALRNNCVDQRVDFKSQSITHFGFALN